MKNRILKSLTAAAFLFAASSSSYASLILVAAENFTGTGLGAVNTILTIESPNNSTDETGGVIYNGTKDIISGDAKKGASQTLTRTLNELNVSNASSLRVVFNALEPGNSESSISLDNLVLKFYRPDGIELFSSGAFKPVFFADTFTGAGNSGFVFALDAEQAAQAQTAVFDLAGSGSFRVGLTASASLATGGFETFFVAKSVNGGGGGGGNGQVPEPATVALIGLGLLGFAASRRKSAKASKA